MILGVVIGAIGFWFDPFTNGQAHTGILKLIGVTLISFTLLPAPDVRGWAETHPLDGPCWSLLQEYIANILYVMVVRKMNNVSLWILVITSGAVLACVAVWHGDVATGWSFETFWIAFVRILFPFFAGLLLFRSGKQIHLPMAFPIC